LEIAVWSFRKYQLGGLLASSFQALIILTKFSTVVEFAIAFHLAQLKIGGRILNALQV
jgi:hypothetical protein